MVWETKFVGRTTELKILQDGLEQARNKRGNVLFITGEAGVGKTRLVEELAKQKTHLNFEFLSGQCIYSKGVDPYLPFIDMFKGYLSSHPYLSKAIQASFRVPGIEVFDFYQIEKSKYTNGSGSGRSIRRKGIKGKSGTAKKEETKVAGPYTSKVIPGAISDDIQITPSDLFDVQNLEGKQRMFETVTKIIIGISKKKPLVAFMDDVHWADEASLHLLHYLARNIKNHQILIVVAYRTEDIQKITGPVHPLQEIITRLGTENLFSVVDLKRMDQKETTEIVKSLLSVHDIPKDFANLIYKETEGNPFFIKEVLKTLIEDGALSIRDGRLQLNISPKEIVIPISIKELINLRLQRLGDELIDVLEYAAVIGNEFQLDLLKNIIDLPDSKLINDLAKLTEAKFIIDTIKDDQFAYQFTHNKIHEVIYNGIHKIKKKMIHLNLAKFLEDTKIDNIDDVVFDLAYHFYYGSDFDRALAYSIDGGEKAMRFYANQEALELYGIALNSIRRLDDKLANTTHYKEKKIEVLSRLGTLNKTMNEWDKALNYFEQIIPICDEINDIEKKANTYIDMGWIFHQMQYWAEAQNYFRKSLILAKEINDKFIEAEAYSGLGAIFEHDGNLEKALEFYTISREFSESHKDYINLARTHNAFGRIYNSKGDFSKAIMHKQKSINIFEKLNDLPKLAKAYTSLGTTYYDLGDLDKNIEYNEKSIKLADQISDIRIKGIALSNTVEALIKSNQLEKAQEYTERALEIFATLEERDMVAFNYVNFGIIYKYKEQWNKAIDYFKTAMEVFDELDVPYHKAECYRQFADIYKNKGEIAKAEYFLKKAKEIEKTKFGAEGTTKILTRIQDIRL